MLYFDFDRLIVELTISGVTNSKKSVLIEYEYPTIELEQMSTTIQFLKVKVEYYSRIFVEY